MDKVVATIAQRYGENSNLELAQRNQEALLINAARYCTIRRLALLSPKEREPIEEAMRSIKEPTLTGQSFDKAIDIAREYLNKKSPTEPEAA
jgi:hypothetical protein